MTLPPQPLDGWGLCDFISLSIADCRFAFRALANRCPELALAYSSFGVTTLWLRLYQHYPSSTHRTRLPHALSPSLSHPSPLLSPTPLKVCIFQTKLILSSAVVSIRLPALTYLYAIPLDPYLYPSASIRFQFWFTMSNPSFGD